MKNLIKKVVCRQAEKNILTILKLLPLFINTYYYEKERLRKRDLFLMGSPDSGKGTVLLRDPSFDYGTLHLVQPTTPQFVGQSHQSLDYMFILLKRHCPLQLINTQKSLYILKT